MHLNWCGKPHPISFYSLKNKYTFMCACYYLNSILRKNHKQYVTIIDLKTKLVKNIY